MSALACNHYMNNLGGQQIGELITYSEALANEDIDRVEAYLQKKWYGTDKPGFRPAVVGTLEVASGATVVSDGNAPVTVSAVKGGGTVEAKIAFAEQPAFVLVATEDGNVGGLTLTQPVDLSQGGTVRLTGAVAALEPGDYVAVVSPSIAAGQSWQLSVENPHRRRSYALRVQDGKLVLSVRKLGYVIQIR